MKGLLRIAHWLDTLATKIGRAAGWIILPLIALIMFDVVTRKLDVTRLYFSDLAIKLGGISVSTLAQDFQWHLHAVLLMLTFGVAYLANAHVRVDIFRELLPRRKQAWVELVGLCLLAAPFLVLMMNEAWQMMELSYHQGEGSESLTGIGKRWIIKSTMVIGFWVLSAAVLATIFRLLVMLFADERDRLDAEKVLSVFPDNEELDQARHAAEAALQAEEDALAIKAKARRR